MNEMEVQQGFRTCPNCNGAMKFLESNSSPEHYCGRCHYSEKDTEAPRTKEQYDMFQKERMSILLGKGA